MGENMDLVIRMILNAAEFASELSAEQARLDEFDAKKLDDKTVNVDADTAAASAKLDEMNAKHMDDKNIDVDADTAAANAKIDALKAKLDSLSNHDMGSSHSGEGIGLLPASIMTGLPMLSPMLAAAAGGAMALSSGLAAAGAGAVGFGAVAVPTLSTVIKAASGGKDAMKGLDSEQRAAVGSLRSFQSFWKSFTASFQSPVLNMFTGGLKALQMILTGLRPAIQGAANAFSGLLKDLNRSLGSPPVKAFFDYLGKMAGPMITAFGRITGNVMLGVMNLLREFGPLSTQMVNGLLKMSQRFAQWSSRIGSSKGFQQFIQYVRENGPVVISIIGNVVSAVGHILVALAPMGAAMLRVVQAVTQWIASFSKAHPAIVQLIASVVAGIGVARLVSPILSAIGIGFTVLRGAVMAFSSGGIVALRAFFVALMGNPVIAIITIIVAAIVGATLLITMHWKQVSSFLNSTWHAISSAAQSIWNGIKSTLSSIWNGIKSGASSIFNSIRSVISSVWNGIRSVTSSVWNGIKSAISSAWNAIRSVIRSGASTVKSVLSGAWSAVRSAATSAWHAISSVVSSAFSRVKSVIRSGASAVRSVMSAAWNAIRSGASSAWNGITGVVRSGISRVGSILRSIGGSAFSWGANLIKMFGNGIRSAIGGVANAAKSAVNSVKKFLGFHSPAEEGPGADADVWAPNLMKMFTHGIVEGTPALQGALSKAITPPTAVKSPNISRLVNGIPVTNGAPISTSTADNSTQYNGPLIGQVIVRNDQDIQKIQQAIYNSQASARRAKGVKGI
ncbi:hypothetical protein ACFP7A_01190 [Sporolactobacillus kofuensis]|uniref:Phage tail tape measure protein n=1 Tax=Sporolactobacillus kofuensis TaxID=269672 RepID=A0ABW1W9G8_9BACL|nr:hypothetical protein [Sporolactobacillus kofuensis]MCO7177012.1 hypothetical protein [Sporolactobacillus kofuensis]